MNLGSKTSDIKLYSRNKYSDGLPYTSNDIHEEKDLSLRKAGIVLDSIIGSSLLENATFNVNTNESNISVRLAKPTPVNLNGEIFLIGNSSNVYPLQIPINYVGSIVLLCWYTNLSHNSTLYEYGGLCNNIIPNDIINEDLNIQTSTRYQIRWNLGYCSKTFDYSNPEISNITIINELKTESGDYSNIALSSSNMSLTGKFYTTPSTTRVPSSDNLIHLLPLALIDNGTIKSYNVQLPMASIESSNTPTPNYHKVWYNPNTEEVKMYFNGAWRDVGGSSIIKQESEPTGNIKEGSIWYNPSLNEFKLYISGVGFVDTYAKMGFVQLQATHTFTSDITTPQDITITIPIDTYLSSDILRISYEGIELIKGINYTLNTANKTITLTNFTVSSGDTLSFIDTRLVGSSDLMTTLSLLKDHINDVGSYTSSGHLKLSDSPSDSLDQNTGVAATPKSVKDVDNKINKYKDETTEKVYELGVSNGLLFMRERSE